MARQSCGVLLSPIQNIGGKWPKTTISDQYFQKYLSLSVQTCLKVRFYQVLHVSVSSMCRNVEILTIWTKNGQKSPFLQKRIFFKTTQVRISGTEMMLGSWNLDQEYLYIVSKISWNRFLKFRFFFNMSKIVDKIGKMSEILDIMRHISKKNQKFKNLFQVLLEPI